MSEEHDGLNDLALQLGGHYVFLADHTKRLGHIEKRLTRIEHTLSDHGKRLTRIQGDLAGVKADLNIHSRMLREILQRLPEA